ncbi:Zinc knuckle CX2CX4HX4C [Sesbania bispinosa]|nr:Zinc knuckle CX2CX4HX4C [Sesbania bispinosa]
MENNQVIQSNEDEQPEELTVELETEDLQSFQLAKKSLIGKICADKPLNKGAVRSILSKAWGEGRDFHVTDMGINLFLFTFSDRKEPLEILQKGPWFVMGHLLSLQCWLPQASVYELNFNRVSIWIQVHGLPLDMLNTKNAAKIINSIAEVVEVESPEMEGRLLRTFVRVRALIDIKKPITTGCWVPRRDLPRVWIILRYEKLQGLCFNCAIIGHEQRICSRDKAMPAIDKNSPKFSARLGVPPAKSIITIAREQGHWQNSKSKPSRNGEGNSSAGKGKENTDTCEGEEQGPQVQPKNLNLPQQSSARALVPEMSVGNVGQEKGKQVVEVDNGIVADKRFGIRCNNPHEHAVFLSEVTSLQERFTQGPHLFPHIVTQQPSSIQVSSNAHINTGPPKKAQNQVVSSKPLTKVDLKSNIIRSGLGPDNIEDLGLVTEFIGTSEDPIILDYPSPTQNKYQGVSLNISEITKCRKFLSVKNSTKKEENKLGYMVEFPDEEEETKDDKPPQKILQEEETQLILGWNNSLNLKRYREDAFVDVTDLFEGLWGKQKRNRLIDIEFPAGSNLSSLGAPEYEDNAEAGEAGLKLPHRKS